VSSSSGGSSSSGSSGSSSSSGSTSSGGVDAGHDAPADAPIDAPADAPIDAPADVSDARQSCSTNVNLTNVLNGGIGAPFHNHALTILAADFLSVVDKTYSIQGGATHDHSITLTAANFAALRAGQIVRVTSTVTLHSHECTVMCA
jgi:hypothetical protein